MSASPAVSDTPLLNDDLFLRTIEANASRLCDAGVALSCEELGQQLGLAGPVSVRGRPKPASAPVDLPSLYASRSRGVLVVVRVEKCEKCPLWHHRGEGSGFVLADDGLCVTCRHMFENEKSGNLLAIDREGAAYAISELVASSVPDDIALFRIDTLQAAHEGAIGPRHRLTAVALRGGVQTGESVSVISHPRHHHYLLTHGVVSRRTERFGGVNGGLKTYREIPTPIVNITADFGSGSSGAPIFDDAGNAVAMVASTTTVHTEPKKDAESHKDGETQMVIKTCVPAESILRLMGR